MTSGVLLFCLLLVAALSLLLGHLLRQRSGLPDGTVIYEDRGGKQTRVLVSHRYGLRGKPDYLLNDGAGWVIPVELKSSRIPRSGRPHRSHALQLAAYFLLVEDALQQRVAYGLVRYKDGVLRIENSAHLRAELLAVMEEMRAALSSEDASRSHRQAVRCRACSVAYACDERLA